MALAGISFFFNREKTESTQSVAIIPFKTTSQIPGQEFLIDGFTEGIRNSLASQEGIKVSARESSFKFRGDVNLKDIGSSLGVQAVIDGLIKIEGERIEVIVKIMNVDDAMQLWSHQYEGRMADILDLQNKIANSISAELASTTQSVVAHKTTSREAYESYLRGRYHWNLRTLNDLNKGIEEFSVAIEKDPAFGAAYAGLADCYTALGYQSQLAPRDVFPKAFAAATKALQLDSTLAEAHATLGFYKFYHEWDWLEAEQEFRKALSLNPNHELVYDWYGYFLTAMQRYDEAQVVFGKAASLDPLSVSIGTDGGFGLYYSKQYDQAAQALMSAIKMNPKFPIAHLWLGRVYQAKEMYDQSIDEYKKMLEGTPLWAVAYAQIGNAYAVSGREAEARAILDSLNSFSKSKYVTSYGVALIYVGLGEKEKAYQWLDKAIEERSHWLVWLGTDPRWAALKSDPKFLKLLAEVGVPEIGK